MSIKNQIPNTLTCINILCGCVSLVYAANGQFIWSSYMIFIAVLFDFADGLTARLLSAQSPLGKQLDSLADMVSFGVAPGFLMYQLMISLVELKPLMLPESLISPLVEEYQKITFIDDLFPYIAFIIPLFTAIRLAKFNLDPSQATEFKGLASPGNAVFMAGVSIYISPEIESMAVALKNLGANGSSLDPDFVTIFLIGLGSTIVIVSGIMIVSVRMFSFKFANVTWRDNKIRYLFLLACLAVISFALLYENLFAAIPIIILLYIGLSMINNLFRNNDEIQS